MSTDPTTNWLEYREVFASSRGENERLIYAITGNYMSFGTGKLWRWQDTGNSPSQTETWWAQAGVTSE